MEIGPIESKRKLVAEVWTGNKEPKLCLDPPVEKEIKELPQAASSKGKTKTWCSEMTDDELLHSLDEYGEFEISTDVIQKIRDYSAQLAESGGFEIDVWPGSFMGVSDIAPVLLSKVDNPSDYDAYESFAKFAMDEYNKEHEKKFDFEQLFDL